MAQPIFVDKLVIGKIDWSEYTAVCQERLGYVPEANSRLSKFELDQLGFTYASGSKKLVSPVYGKIIYLL